MKITSRITLYRASLTPEKALAGNLYQLAIKEKKLMEDIMKKPFYLLYRKIDGIIEQEGIYYGYQEEIPASPSKYALFVFVLNDKSVIVSRRRKVRTYDRILGIVTVEIKKVPLDREGIL